MRLLKNYATSEWSRGLFKVALIVFILSIVGVTIVKKIKKERINVVFYGENTRYYSLSIADTIHYSLVFSPDLTLMVPGGYGYYRTGALGKLVYLEKDPDIIRKTFSLATSSFVDYYFYPKKPEIYYAADFQEKHVLLPSFQNVFFANSNAGLLDRMLIYIKLFARSSQEFRPLASIQSYVKSTKAALVHEDLAKAIQGYLYQKKYRSEKRNTQIIYVNDSKTATTVGQIIEGNGIRIADIAQSAKSIPGCQVKENTRTHSLTAQSLADFFRCRLITEDTGVYDILLILGKREGEWEVVD